ncbi:hypothetical protein CIRMBP1303_02021 [Enterococcus cecorum]|nr:hypothetical protein CIRMBP1303_02021 [Enterococcus cecorum]
MNLVYLDGKKQPYTASEIIEKYGYVFDLIANYFNVDKQQLIDFVRGAR